MIELELGNKEDLLKKEGKARMSEAGKRHSGNQYTGMEPVSQNDKPSKPHSTRATIAKAAGVSTGQGVNPQHKKRHEFPRNVQGVNIFKCME